ncbi:hypothetical protein ACFQ4C_07555 [Larkinella insperata]|uniref:PAS domain-containing protein n=1 Tax=Larkinella insperata TaxID=332158 RepID=A0ABW3Q6K2_9BACT
MSVQAKFIYQPTSGDYREKRYDIPRQDGIIRAWNWVLITKSDGSEWVACLHGAEENILLLAVLKDTSIVFIVSAGQGYFIDAETEALLGYTQEDTIRELAASVDESVAVFADRWEIFTVNKALEVKALAMPFEFYSVRFKQPLGDTLEIEYEEMYSGDYKTAYLSMKTLQVTLAE